MNEEQCRYEADTLLASETGVWSESLLEHLGTCDSCRSTVRVAQSLKTVAADTQIPANSPGFSLLWMKAEVIRKQERLARLEFWQKLGVFGSVVVGVILFVLGRILFPSDAAIASGRELGRDVLTMILPFVGTAGMLYLMRVVAPDLPARRRSSRSRRP